MSCSIRHLVVLGAGLAGSFLHAASSSHKEIIKNETVRKKSIFNDIVSCFFRKKRRSSAVSKLPGYPLVPPPPAEQQARRNSEQDAARSLPSTMCVINTSERSVEEVQRILEICDYCVELPAQDGCAKITKFLYYAGDEQPLFSHNTGAQSCFEEEGKQQAVAAESPIQEESDSPISPTVSCSRVTVIRPSRRDSLSQWTTSDDATPSHTASLGSVVSFSGLVKDLLEHTYALHDGQQEESGQQSPTIPAFTWEGSSTLPGSAEDTDDE